MCFHTRKARLGFKRPAPFLFPPPHIHSLMLSRSVTTSPVHIHPSFSAGSSPTLRRTLLTGSPIRAHWPWLLGRDRMFFSPCPALPATLPCRNLLPRLLTLLASPSLTTSVGPPPRSTGTSSQAIHARLELPRSRQAADPDSASELSPFDWGSTSME